MNDKIDVFFDTLKRLTAEYIPKLGGAIIVLIVGIWLINRVSFLMTKGMQRRQFDVSLQSFLSSVFKVLLKVLLVVTVAGMLGIQTTSFVAILGAAGLAVGLALQGSLSNFAGGVLTLIFKPYKVGDTIEAQGQKGTVQEIQIFNTILLSGDNRTIILPNGAVSNNTIINYSRYGNLRVDMLLLLDAMADVQLAKKLALDACHSSTDALKNPEPFVLFNRLVNDDIELVVSAYADPLSTGFVKDTVQYEIKNRFLEAGVQFAKNKIIVENQA